MLRPMSANMDNSGVDSLDAMRQETVTPSPGPAVPAPSAIAGILASALNMEDEISSGVYQDYLKPQNWPAGFDKDAFLEIRKRLTVLIQGIEKHKKTLHALSKEYGPDRSAI